MSNRQQFQFRGNRNNQPQVQQAPPVSFSSGMTSQQKYQSIVQSVQISLSGRPDQSIKGCQMHPKASQKCRKCQTIIQDSLKQIKQTNKPHNDLNQLSTKEEFILSEQIPQQIKLNSQNPKHHLNQKLQSNIMSSKKYKILKELKSVKQVLSELSHDQIPIDAYRKGTNEDPTEFVITLFRIMELKPTKPQLVIMMRSNNVNVRALGLIYVRIAVDFQQIYSFLKASFDDNKLINALMTVGELAYKLSSEEGMDQGGIRMPRIPTKIQKAMDKKVLEYKNGMGEIEPIVMQNIPNEMLCEQVEKRPGQQRSRSRQRQKRQRSQSSSSSSSSSSNSSSSSSSSSEQIGQQKIPKSNQQKVQTSTTKTVLQSQRGTKIAQISSVQKNSSLSDVRSRIQQSLKEKQQKQLKRKLLLQKYNAQDKIQDDQEQNQHSEESDSVEKYQVN